ncbi:helix-turn-helix transcriptional regulator [Halomicrococcus gelatinilyticus]|uniref:helix-turn-helix transcriptional regulator n=1 Tax=Halomicrococcus gelatinilyticus TaxID=1702103 RepID=UPI002E10AD95
MRRLLAVGLIVVLLAGSFPASGVTQTDTTATAAPQTIASAQEFDSVEFQILVHEDGSATWTFRYERTLDNETERQQFREFARKFENESTPLYTNFQKNAIALTEDASTKTERVMKAEDFSRNATLGGVGLQKNLGVVEMSFTWTSFASMGDNNTLVIGDAFRDGLYLGENQTLVVETQSDMPIVAAKPTEGRAMTGDSLADSEAVSWSGERKFNDQRPMVEFDAPNQTVTSVTETTSPPGGDGPGENSEEPASESPMMLMLAALVVIVGLAAAFAWRQGGLGSLPNGDGGRPDAGPGGAATESEDVADNDTEPAVSDEELLTDEARVKKLLHENGGRMKQVNIVDETGWSKSKVSMLLSEMEDQGDISKLRVGRENIISLDGHEPDAAGSPLDE